jgi:hypothetical protein
MGFIFMYRIFKVDNTSTPLSVMSSWACGEWDTCIFKSRNIGNLANSLLLAIAVVVVICKLYEFDLVFTIDMKI